MYRQDYQSWVQVLQTFLSGEAKAIALAFGAEAEFEEVEGALVHQYGKCSLLTSDDLDDFFSIQRRGSESAICYAIRLRTLAERVPDMSEESRVSKVRSKFLASLTKAVRRQLSLQLGCAEQQAGM